MRGQTTLDFAIGISIFLAVVLFTFGFIPTILDPFDATASENPTLADRTADELAHGMLGSPAEPHVLDRYCTVAFFDESATDFSGCDFEDEPVEDRLPLTDFQRVSISITRGGELLCWDGGVDEPQITTGCGSGGTDLASGDDPLPQDATVSARRTVLLDGETATLEVVIW